MNAALRSPAAVLERIGAMEAAGRPWSLSSAEVRSLLGLDPAEYYRRIAAAEAAGNTLVSTASATGGFSQGNVGELVALLELFSGDDAERALREAGVFFAHSEQAEILQLFHGLVAETNRRHRVREQEFAAMLRAFGRWQRAVSVYLAEFLPVEALIQATVDGYCAPRSFTFPLLARSNVSGLLAYFFQKHVLDREVLFEPIRAALYAQAVREGFARTAGAGASHAGVEEEVPRESGKAQALSACQVMGIEPAALRLPLLKGQYKRLMKRFHPDLNPQGLRRCQEINAAYALLLSRLEGGRT